MTVDELTKELNKLCKEGYGKLNVVYRDDCVIRGLSTVDTIDVLVDDDYVGKFVKLDSKKE